MARLVGVRQFWTHVGFFAGCVALSVGGAAAARLILTGPAPTLSSRIAAVTLGVLGIAVWWPFMVWLYRRSDEFERHGIMLTLATAFGVVTVGMATIDYLERASIIPWGAVLPRWQLAVAAWFIAVIALAIRGRRSA